MAKAGKHRIARPVPELLVKPDAWPANAVTMRPLAELNPYANNARTHSAEQVEQLCEAIARYGWTAPVLVDEAGTIIAGHGRVIAAKRLGLAEVPVMVAVGWSEDRKRAFCLADNRITENAGWDKKALARELEALASTAPDVDLKLLGFSQRDLDRLLPKAQREGFSDPDARQAEPPADAPPVSALGDIWQLGEHRLICGDSTNAEHVAAVLGGERPGLMVTDPPYGVDYDPAWRAEAGVAGDGAALGRVLNDHQADWRAAWSLFAGAVAYVWHGALHASVVEASLVACGFEIRSQIVWAKEAPVLSRGDYHWQHEPCWYAVRKGAVANWAGDRSQSTLWEPPSTLWRVAHRKNETGHGTQKPIECMRRPMVNNSRPGDAVYEPFSGSGTSIIAAEMTGRRALALELNPAYVDLAVQRWERFTKKRAILAAGELTIEQLAVKRGAELRRAA